MNDISDKKTIVSLFQIPDEYRLKLKKIAQKSSEKGFKLSINTCIIDALEAYLILPQDHQLKPIIPKTPLTAFTVRTSSILKQKIIYCAASWQLKSSVPVSMNAIVNASIICYLRKYEETEIN